MDNKGKLHLVGANEDLDAASGEVSEQVRPGVEKKIGGAANTKVSLEADAKMSSEANDSEAENSETVSGAASGMAPKTWKTGDKVIDLTAYRRMVEMRDRERMEEKLEQMSERRQAILSQARQKAAFRRRVRDIVAMSAVGVGTALSIMGMVASVKSLDRKTAERLETPDKTIEAESVTFYGAPNVRETPVVEDIQGGNNSYGRIGEDAESVTIEYDGTVYVVEGDDANGNWYGFKAEDLAEELTDEGFISEWMGKKIEGDDNGIAWVNGEYCSVEEAAADGTAKSIESLYSD